VPSGKIRTFDPFEILSLHALTIFNDESLRIKSHNFTIPTVKGLWISFAFMTQSKEGTNAIRIIASRIEGWFDAIMHPLHSIASSKPSTSSSIIPLFSSKFK
jgi:xanthine/uracil/vitamin C permease (AzgA family)